MSNHVLTQNSSGGFYSGGFNSVDTKEAHAGDKEAAEWMSNHVLTQNSSGGFHSGGFNSGGFHFADT